MRLAITYDISDDRIRNRIFRILEKYGAWRQYSVFELEIDKIQQIKLEDDIKSRIEDGDKVRIYQLCDRCVGNIKDLGEKTPEKVSNVI